MNTYYIKPNLCSLKNPTNFVNTKFLKRCFFNKSHNPLKSNPSVYLASREVILIADQTSVAQTIESQFHGELATKEDRMYLGSNGRFDRRKLT